MGVGYGFRGNLCIERPVRLVLTVRLWLFMQFTSALLNSSTQAAPMLTYYPRPFVMSPYRGTLTTV
jgi:hypothetical protein